MEKVLRAAAYGRVSTNSRAQEHSFKNQNEYWERTLTNDPKYDYVGMYADQGISGKRLKYRPQMLSMLDACRAGEIDIVFTKSVQRFARNTVELLEVVRELREKRIPIIFEKEGINTLEITSDMYLTIAAMVAEQDLTRYGANVAWSIRDRFEKGELTVVGVRLLGYKSVNKEIRIVPEEAEIVKLIYELYATGKYGTGLIARKLTAMGIPAMFGGEWRDTFISRILQNEKYKGDALLYKSYTENGEKHINKGEHDMYYVENSHPPIVSVELWEKVNAMIKKKISPKVLGKEKPSYPFTGMLYCGKCGLSYSHKINSAGTKYACPYWKCRTQLKYGKDTCDNRGVKDEVLKEMFIDAYNEFIANDCYGQRDGELKAAIDRLNEEENELLALKIRGFIKAKDFEKDRAQIDAERERIKQELRRYRAANIRRKPLTARDTLDEEMIKRILKRIFVKDMVLTFEFYNGVKISRPYSNGESGNQIGWLDKKREREAKNGTSDL